jgi:hypothetical protein
MRIENGLTVGVHHLLHVLYGEDLDYPVIRERMYVWDEGRKRSPMALEGEQAQARKHFLDYLT